MYNKNIIKHLGLKNPPDTYSQFDSASEKFKNENIDAAGYVDKWFGYSEVLVTWWQRFFDFYPLYLAASGGGALVKNNKAAFDNKYSVEVFTFLRNLYAQDYFAKERLCGITGFFNLDRPCFYLPQGSRRGSRYQLSCKDVYRNRTVPACRTQT